MEIEFRSTAVGAATMVRIGSAAVFAARGHAIGSRVQNLYTSITVVRMVVEKRQKGRRVTTMLYVVIVDTSEGKYRGHTHCQIINKLKKRKCPEHDMKL